MTKFARQGITPNTIVDRVLDSGVLMRNVTLDEETGGITGEIVGAFGDDSEVKITSTMSYPKIKGAPSDKLLGMGRMLGGEASIKVNLIEINSDLLVDALPGATVADAGVWEKIVGGPVGIDNYLDNVALVVDHAGDDEVPFVVILKNAITDGELPFKFKDTESGVVELTYNATWDPRDMDTPPWEIYLPKTTAPIS